MRHVRTANRAAEVDVPHNCRSMAVPREVPGDTTPGTIATKVFRGEKGRMKTENAMACTTAVCYLRRSPSDRLTWRRIA